MIENIPKFHTFDIEYNGSVPFMAAASEPMSVTIGFYTGMRAVSFRITHDLDKNTSKHYRLSHLMPGDRLKITYDGPCVDGGMSIDQIELHDRPTSCLDLKVGSRIGFDITSGGKKRRLSYPEDGSHINLTIANVPRDHARAWVNAGSSDENWNWQQEDLYAGDSIEIEIVETDWCDAFPNVERIDRVIQDEPSR